MKAATGNERRPAVDRRYGGTCSCSVNDDRRRKLQFRNIKTTRVSYFGPVLSSMLSPIVRRWPLPIRWISDSSPVYQRRQLIGFIITVFTPHHNHVHNKSSSTSIRVPGCSPALVSYLRWSTRPATILPFPVTIIDRWRWRFCFRFLADRTNGRAYATVLRLYVCLSSVTLCVVAKRCVLEQKLLLRAYRKSYMRNRLVPKWMTLTLFRGRIKVTSTNALHLTLNISETVRDRCGLSNGHRSPGALRFPTSFFSLYCSSPVDNNFLAFRNISKICATRSPILRLKCTNIQFPLGRSATDPNGRAYGSPQTTYSCK